MPRFPEPGCADPVRVFDPAEVHRLPLFRSVSKAKLMEALAAFMPSEVDPGQVLMVEGEADRSMVLVLDGELSVHIGRDNVEVARMGRGEVVGEMALFGVLDRRAATVRTLSPCRLLILDLSGLTFLRRKRSPVVTLLEEYALVIAAATQHPSLALNGGGSKTALAGNAPVVLDMSGLRGVLEYEPDE